MFKGCYASCLLMIEFIYTSAIMKITRHNLVDTMTYDVHLMSTIPLIKIYQIKELLHVRAHCPAIAGASKKDPDLRVPSADLVTPFTWMVVVTGCYSPNLGVS